MVVLGPPRVPGWAGISSSLLLWLAKSSGTDPAELAGLPEEEVERRLLDRFVPTAYPDTPLPNGRRPRWRAGQAQDWLRFLSRHCAATSW